MRQVGNSQVSCDLRLALSSEKIGLSKKECRLVCEVYIADKALLEVNQVGQYLNIWAQQNSFLILGAEANLCRRADKP